MLILFQSTPSFSADTLVSKGTQLVETIRTTPANELLQGTASAAVKFGLKLVLAVVIYVIGAWLIRKTKKIIAKGLELVRRDWAPIAKKTQEDILMAILEEGNVKKAEKIISKVLKQIKSGDLDMKELVIHTQITKNLDDYKQVGPHVIAAREIESHGIKVGKGTIVQYIIAKGKGSISQRAVPYEYSEGIEYDKEYYIENQLIPAVSRMMEPLGYDKDRLRELSSNERQQSLDAFF